MKRRACALLMSAVLFIALLPGTLAKAPSLIVALKLGSPHCVVGMGISQVDEGNAAVYPVSEQGRTLVPVSPIVKAFGGSSGWEADTGRVTFTLGENTVALLLGSDTILVNGVEGQLDVPAKAMNNRTYVPVRAVLEGLGLTVEYSAKHQIVVVADGVLDKDNLEALGQVKTLIEKTAPKGEAITLTQQSYALASGTVNAKVISVDPADPRVRITAAVPDGTLNVTRKLATTAQYSGATALINANFFEAYQTVKDPIGHIMIGGQFLYASTGISSLGITSTGEMRYGRPAVFVRIKTTDDGTARQWAAFEVNTLKQYAGQITIYTPARGATVPIAYAGAVLTVENGVSTGYRAVTVGEKVVIPAKGYLVYFSTEATKKDYFTVPEVGRKLALEPYLYQEDAEGFQLDGVQTMISGAPRLVKDGAIETYLEPQYAKDSRFTTNSAPRTAVGTTRDGKLLLVSVPAATIQQMRELMLKLGCVDAINLDGGASTGMYYKGQMLATPGRELVTTLQVFVTP